jgi:hypothetical protein
VQPLEARFARTSEWRRMMLTYRREPFRWPHWTIRRKQRTDRPPRRRRLVERLAASRHAIAERIAGFRRARLRGIAVFLSVMPGHPGPACAGPSVNLGRASTSFASERK